MTFLVRLYQRMGEVEQAEPVLLELVRIKRKHLVTDIPPWSGEVHWTNGMPVLADRGVISAAGSAAPMPLRARSSVLPESAGRREISHDRYR